MLFEIGQSKNKNKCEENLLPQYTLTSKINAPLQAFVQVRYIKKTYKTHYTNSENNFA